MDKEGVVQEAIAKANERLKSDKEKVRILRARDSLYVQFTAPLMPGEIQVGGKPNKQYKKSLGIKATTDGVKRAYKKALDISYKLEHNQFKWEDYPAWLRDQNLTTKTEPSKKIKELLELFEKEYFFKRQRNPQSERTFKKYKELLNRKLNLEEPLTQKSIDQTIAKTEAGSSQRWHLVKSLSVFCRHVNFKYDFEGLRSGYKTKPREIPSDEEIIEAWHKIQVKKCSREGEEESYGWVFGMLATYGLRPHELLAIDYQRSLKPPYYEIYLDKKLTDGLKTGNRTIYPLPYDWVDKFDLIHVKNQCILNKKVDNLKDKVAKRFQLKKLGFPPYNLRHRYAIRGHERGVPIGQMAKWMGHSVQMHTDIYQKWMPDSTHKKIFEEYLKRGKKPEVITEEMPSYEDLLRKNAELQERLIQTLERVNQLMAQLAEVKQ
jgi:hypothetical protein